MPVEVVVNDYPGLTGLLAAVVVVLVVGTLVRLSQAICICWVERKTVTPGTQQRQLIVIYTTKLCCQHFLGSSYGFVSRKCFCIILSYSSILAGCTTCFHITFRILFSQFFSHPTMFVR
jgi:hypothetical protein